MSRPVIAPIEYVSPEGRLILRAHALFGGTLGGEDFPGTEVGLLCREVLRLATLYAEALDHLSAANADLAAREAELGRIKARITARLGPGPGRK